MSKTILVYHATFSIQRKVIFDSVAVSLICKNQSYSKISHSHSYNLFNTHDKVWIYFKYDNYAHIREFNTPELIEEN